MFSTNFPYSPRTDATVVLCESQKVTSVLPLYKISVLLKTGGTGVFILTHNINKVIKAPFERFDR